MHSIISIPSVFFSKPLSSRLLLSVKLVDVDKVLDPLISELNASSSAVHLVEVSLAEA